MLTLFLIKKTNKGYAFIKASTPSEVTLNSYSIILDRIDVKYYDSAVKIREKFINEFWK